MKLQIVTSVISFVISFVIVRPYLSGNSKMETPKNYPSNETALVNRIAERLKKKYGARLWVLKVHGNQYQRKGVPDLLICFEGRFIAFEIKHRKPGESIQRIYKRVSDLQQLEMEGISAAGGIARMCWLEEQVMTAVSASVEI